MFFFQGTQCASRRTRDLRLLSLNEIRSPPRSPLPAVLPIEGRRRSQNASSVAVYMISSCAAYRALRSRPERVPRSKPFPYHAAPRRFPEILLFVFPLRSRLNFAATISQSGRGTRTRPATSPLPAVANDGAAWQQRAIRSNDASLVSADRIARCVHKIGRAHV